MSETSSVTSATCKVVVLNRAGVHARPSLAIVETVRQSKSKVEIRSPRQAVDAKDILQILGLGASQGTELTLAAHGPDAEDVLEKLAALFASHFGMDGQS